MADYENRRNMDSFTAGLLGVVIGAIGSAVVILMSSKENRQKTREKFEEFKEKGTEAFNTIEKKGRELAQRIKSEAEEITAETEQRLTRPRKSK